MKEQVNEPNIIEATTPSSSETNTTFGTMVGDDLKSLKAPQKKEPKKASIEDAQGSVDLAEPQSLSKVTASASPKLPAQSLVGIVEETPKDFRFMVRNERKSQMTLSPAKGESFDLSKIDLLERQLSRETRENQMATMRLADLEKALTEKERQIESSASLVRAVSAERDKAVSELMDIRQETLTAEKRSSANRGRLLTLQDKLREVEDQLKFSKKEARQLNSKLIASQKECIEQAEQFEGKLNACTGKLLAQESQIDSLKRSLGSSEQLRQEANMDYKAIFNEQSIATKRVSSLENLKSKLENEVEQFRQLSSEYHSDLLVSERNTNELSKQLTEMKNVAQKNVERVSLLQKNLELEREQGKKRIDDLVGQLKRNGGLLNQLKAEIATLNLLVNTNSECHKLEIGKYINKIELLEKTLLEKQNEINVLSAKENQCLLAVESARLETYKSETRIASLMELVGKERSEVETVRHMLENSYSDVQNMMHSITEHKAENLNVLSQLRSAELKVDELHEAKGRLENKLIDFKLAAIEQESEWSRSLTQLADELQLRTVQLEDNKLKMVYHERAMEEMKLELEIVKAQHLEAINSFFKKSAIDRRHDEKKQQVIDNILVEMKESLLSLQCRNQKLSIALRELVLEVLSAPDKSIATRRTLEARKIRMLEVSGLFDEEWYLKASPDVLSSGMSAITHFVRHGLKEGRAPNQDWYLKIAADPAP